MILKIAFFVCVLFGEIGLFLVAADENGDLLTTKDKNVAPSTSSREALLEEIKRLRDAKSAERKAKEQAIFEKSKERKAKEQAMAEKSKERKEKEQAMAEKSKERKAKEQAIFAQSLTECNITIRNILSHYMGNFMNLDAGKRCPEKLRESDKEFCSELLNFCNRKDARVKEILLEEGYIYNQDHEYVVTIPASTSTRMIIPRSRKNSELSTFDKFVWFLNAVITVEVKHEELVFWRDLVSYFWLKKHHSFVFLAEMLGTVYEEACDICHKTYDEEKQMRKPVVASAPSDKLREHLKQFVKCIHYYYERRLKFLFDHTPFMHKKQKKNFPTYGKRFGVSEKITVKSNEITNPYIVHTL